MKVSDFVFNFLKEKGVDTIFSVSGGAAAHLLNSIKDKGFNYVCNYHEQSSAMSAEGYARIKNKPACVLVTNGPGSSNTITGVLGAYQDSIPMIVISGQVPINQSLSSIDNLNLRQLGVQECDIIKMVEPITKYSIQIIDKNTVEYHIKQAYELCTTGRMGPVWIDIPLDIQNSDIEIQNMELKNEVQTVNYDFDLIHDLLKTAKKPIIVTGNGVHLSKSENLLHKLKLKLKIPIVSTWTSKDLFDNDDEFYVGNFGLLGERSANFAVQNCDFMLILGSRLSIPNIGYQSHLFSPKSIKIMVDIDENEMNKPTIKINHKINSDLNLFIKDFLEKITNKDIPNYRDWVDRTLGWKKDYPVFQKEYGEVKEKINSFYFMEVLSSKIKNDDIVVTDMGTSYTCTMQSLKMNGNSRLFTSSACCSMGFGLPGSIGAYYADKNKNVILIAGDGGFQMNIQELQTVVHNKIPVKIFILNNNGYLAISLMQDNLFNGRYVGANKESGISSPDFTKIAKAYGIKNYRFNNNIELVNGIDEILNTNEPVICEIMMLENQLLTPRVQSSKTKDGEIISGSLENMYPYLSDEEMKKIME
jgi:acetolactate synthase-1/2/3 large subunit